MNLKKIWNHLNGFHIIFIFLGIFFLLNLIMRKFSGIVSEIAAISAFAMLLVFVMTPIIRRWYLFKDESWDVSIKKALITAIVAIPVFLVLEYLLRLIS